MTSSPLSLVCQPERLVPGPRVPAVSPCRSPARGVSAGARGATPWDASPAFTATAHRPMPTPYSGGLSLRGLINEIAERETVNRAEQTRCPNDLPNKLPILLLVTELLPEGLGPLLGWVARFTPGGAP
jgi:hypothetical protein